MTLRFRAVAVAAFVGILLSSGLVLRTSRAAFTAQTANDDNSFVAGALNLTHDAPTSARFAVSGWLPGDTATECFDVTYTGTARTNSGVRMFVTNLVDVDGGADAGDAARLSDDLDVRVEVLGPGNSCNAASPAVTGLYGPGTLAALAASATGYADALDPGWTPAASPEARGFRVTVTLGADTPNDAQGDAATVDLVWEVQAGV